MDLRSQLTDEKSDNKSKSDEIRSFREKLDNLSKDYNVLSSSHEALDDAYPIERV